MNAPVPSPGHSPVSSKTFVYVSNAEDGDIATYTLRPDTGTLEPGKMADVVLWSGDPFSVYSKAEKVWNEGWLVFDRLDPKKQYKTDFNLGQTAPGVGR